MKKYPSYKPSGVEWIGEIPEGWLLRRLKHNTYIKARVGWHGLKSDEFTTTGPYCITGTDFINGEINWKSCYRIGTERYNEDPYIQLKENDLLITKDGTIGKTAIVKKMDGEATLNSGVFVVRPERDYDTRFLYWILNSSVFTEFVNFYSKGSTIIHLYQDTFCNLPVPFPPLDQQHKISTYLDHTTQTIDTAIQKKQRLIELLQEEKTAMINQAVTRGLDPNVPMKDSGVEWLGMVPENWQVKKVKHTLTKIIGGGTPSTDNPDFWNGRIPWVSPKDMKVETVAHTEDYITEIALANSSTTLLDPGAILIVVRSGILKHTLPSATNAVPVSLNQDLKALFPDKFLTKDYLLLMMKGYEQQILTFTKKLGATVDSLDMDAFKNFYVGLPPDEEQAKIVDKVKIITQKISSTINRIDQEINLLQEYRTALINEVVTGKICVLDELRELATPIKNQKVTTA
jgi:type I restriction enzyme, S subunit